MGYAEEVPLMEKKDGNFWMSNLSRRIPLNEVKRLK
jgi:hypothetical protein